jgi:hypothetical protein
MLLKDARELPERNHQVSLPLRVGQIARRQLFSDFQALFVGAKADGRSPRALCTSPIIS